MLGGELLVVVLSVFIRLPFGMIVCMWNTSWSGAECTELAEQLLAVAPRLALGIDIIWADARGLDAVELAQQLLTRTNARVGIGRTPITAEIAARTATNGINQAPDDERTFIAPLPLTVLSIDPKLEELLHGVGVETCGQLAALEREAIEVRFGPELVRAWHFARAEDPRRVFGPIPAEPPHASIEFVDYVISDPERLIFSVNALLGGVCEDLRANGRHARRIRLSLSLANGDRWERTLRPARPSASRAVWLRLTRAVLEKITVADAVNGIALDVDGTESAVSVQGDLFDAGFATVSAVDAALARLIEAQGDVLARPETNEHPLAEKRTAFVAETPVEYLDSPVSGRARDPALTLQLFNEPREILVETVRRRDHILPIRYRDGKWIQLVNAAGPDRVSGGRWEEPYAREYFRGVTVDGVLVWLYRDARTDLWYLHGYWD